jgi:MFS family permease
VLLIQAVLTQLLTFTLRPTAAYRALELAVPTAWLGVLGACFAVVPLVLAVLSGQATNRFGERRVMVGSALILGSAGVFVLVGNSIIGLVVGSVVLGTGHLFTVVSQQAAVANTAGPGKFDTALGQFTFAASLGQAIGPRP